MSDLESAIEDYRLKFPKKAKEGNVILLGWENESPEKIANVEAHVASLGYTSSHLSVEELLANNRRNSQEG